MTRGRLGAAIALVTLGLGAVVQAASATELGRLFFTPGERLSLDRQRAHGVTTGTTAALAIGGEVRRSDGRHTVWINDRPHHEDAAADGLVVKRGSAPGRISLGGDGFLPSEVKVGTVRYPGLADTADPLAGGQVVVHRKGTGNAR